MATITHVTAGEVALAAHQNTLIDQVNGNTTSISDLDGRVTALEDPPFVPRCVLRKSVDQIIPDGATNGDIVVTWDIAESSNNAMHQGDTIVIPEFGEYLVAAQVNIAEGGTQAGECILYIADVTTAGGIADTAVAAFGQPGVPAGSPGGLGNGLSTSTVRQFDAGATLNVQVYQSSGADRTARYAAFGGCTFAVTKQSEQS